MPEMNGIEFLGEAKKIFPDVPRIILTGYADKENSIRAINEIGIFQYIEKPWDNDQLLMVIENAIAQKTLREQLTDRIRALDHAMLERDKLAARDEYLRNELALAERLQRSMLPSLLPDTDKITMHARYHPALEIGGDFYDIMPLADDRHAFLVADATGHGIQAALSTAVLKFAFQSFVHCDCTPGDILKGMNNVLSRGLPDDTYVAALVASIDMNSARVEVTNAGLPNPMLVRTSEDEVERVPATGLMLGMVDDDFYEPKQTVNVDLRGGDKLLVYTDGLSEVENGSGEQFDDAEFARHLCEHANIPCDQLSETLVAASRQHGHDDHEWDDVTVFGIEAK